VFFLGWDILKKFKLLKNYGNARQYSNTERLDNLEQKLLHFKVAGILN
jgi:hypothetical protein